jgi:hypothetical protein
MKHPAPLIPIHGPEFCPTERKISVAFRSIVVDHDVEGTIHGFQLIFQSFMKKRRIHGIVKLRVPALMPDVELGYMRGIDNLITILKVFLVPEFLDNAPYGRALGMPKD